MFFIVYINKYLLINLFILKPARPKRGQRCVRIDEESGSIDSIAQRVYEGFYNFKLQHCPHLVIFIIEYFDLIWLHKCNEWPLFYNIAILKLEKF